MLRYFLPLALFGLLAFLLYKGLSLNPQDIGSTRIDKAAPSFSLPDVKEAGRVLSDKDFLGKVSLFNVWASWCVTCRQEHPLLMQLAKQTDIPIYGLNYKDTLEEARTVLTKTGDPYVASGFDEKGRVGMDWGVTGTPETFVVDKKGIVRYKRTGPLTVELLQETILPLITQLKIEN